jgi:hypothetical protein
MRVFVAAATGHLEASVPEQAPEGLVLRYGILYGHGASDLMLEVVRKRQMPVVDGGTGIWSFTEVADAAAAAVAAAKPELGWTPKYPSWRDGFPVWAEAFKSGKAA